MEHCTGSRSTPRYLITWYLLTGKMQVFLKKILGCFSEGGRGGAPTHMWLPTPAHVQGFRLCTFLPHVNLCCVFPSLLRHVCTSNSTMIIAQNVFLKKTLINLKKKRLFFFFPDLVDDLLDVLLCRRGERPPDGRDDVLQVGGHHLGRSPQEDAQRCEERRGEGRRGGKKKCTQLETTKC